MKTWNQVEHIKITHVFYTTIIHELSVDAISFDSSFLYKGKSTQFTNESSHDWSHHESL